MRGVLVTMYPIPVGCELFKKCNSLTVFFSVFFAGWVACRVVWVVGGQSGRPAFTMSMPSGKLARIASGVMVFVLDDGRVSQ
jgi:hypothetical protein